mgnify:CR=1 FL=1
MQQSQELHAVANFLFEMGVLAKTPRSAFYFLGSGQQSVAEHLNRTVYIGFTLAKLAGNVDCAKVCQMCLFHDAAEARTSDLNYVHQQYLKVDEHRAINAMTQRLPFGEEIRATLQEFEHRQSAEAILAKDADNLEWIMSLKELLDLGNERAKAMITNAKQRLRSELAKQLVEIILETKSDNWYLENTDDQWWINRKIN